MRPTSLSDSWTEKERSICNNYKRGALASRNTTLRGKFGNEEHFEELQQRSI